MPSKTLGTHGTQGKMHLNLTEELDHYGELLKIVVLDNFRWYYA
jgi:hypothetical protein